MLRARVPAVVLEVVPPVVGVTDLAPQSLAATPIVIGWEGRVVVLPLLRWLHMAALGPSVVRDGRSASCTPVASEIRPSLTRPRKRWYNPSVTHRIRGMLS
jgi:hypothetical protein